MKKYIVLYFMVIFAIMYNFSIAQENDEKESAIDEIKEKARLENERLGIISGNIQKLCPVSNAAIDKKIFAEYKGRKIFFKDETNKEKFYLYPEMYFNKLIENKIDLERVANPIAKEQDICPVTGKKLKNKNHYAIFKDVDGFQYKIYTHDEASKKQLESMSLPMVFVNLKNFGFKVEQYDEKAEKAKEEAKKAGEKGIKKETKDETKEIKKAPQDESKEIKKEIKEESKGQKKDTKEDKKPAKKDKK